MIYKNLQNGIFVLVSTMVLTSLVPVQAKTPALGTNTITQNIATKSPQSDWFARKKIILSELHLHKLLTIIKTNVQDLLKEFLMNKDDDSEMQKALFAASRLSEEALILMDDVVTELNANRCMYNPEIEYRFLKICTRLKDVPIGTIKPRHLRDLSSQLKEFNQFVTFYCLNRRDFLGSEDLAFFNKLTRFNHILLFCLLNEDYLGIDFFDSATDWVVFRPWEFACRHKVLTALVVASIAAAGGYYYYQNYYKNRLNAVYFEGARQSSAECGVYALVHAVAMSHAHDEQEAKELVERVKDRPLAVANVKKIIGERVVPIRTQRARTMSRKDRVRLNKMQSTDWLDIDELEPLVDDPVFVRAVARDLGITHEQVSPIVVIQNPEDIGVGASDNKDAISESVHAFRNRTEPQTVMLHMVKNEPGARGHWIAISIRPPEQGEKAAAVKPWVVDSMGGYHNDGVARVLDVYHKRDVPASGDIPALGSLETVRNICEHSTDGTPQERIARALGHFAAACANRLEHDKNFFARPDKVQQRARYQQAFDAIRGYCFGYEIADIDGIAFGTEVHRAGAPAPEPTLENQRYHIEGSSFDDFVAWVADAVGETEE